MGLAEDWERFNEVNPGALAVECLTAGLATLGSGQHVGTKVPTNRPDKFVLVRSDGGPEINVALHDTQIVVQCYDRDEQRARDTIRKCLFLLKAAVGQKLGGKTPVMHATKTGGPTRLDDPDIEGVARYQAIIVWRVRRG